MGEKIGTLQNPHFSSVEAFDDLLSHFIKVRMMLDNIEQAVMSFQVDLLIDSDYSEKVLEILERERQDMEGSSLQSLVFDHADLDQDKKAEAIQTLQNLFALECEPTNYKDEMEKHLHKLPTEVRIKLGHAWKFLKLSWRWWHNVDGSLHRIILILEDVTEAKELQESLEMQTEKTISLGEMAANFAHDIAAPNSIISIANAQLKQSLSVLQEDVLKLFDGQDDPEVKRVYDHFQRSFAECLQLFPEMELASQRIHDLHQAVRNQFRNVQNPEGFDFRQLLDECLVLARSRSKGLRMEVRCPYGIEIYAMRSKWSSVVSNLLNNACDILREVRNLPENGPHILILVEDTKTHLHMQIEDAGPGVPGCDRDKIFLSSFTTKKAGLGTGLGLAICKRIVEEHNGTLHLGEGRELKGACFVIEVPWSAMQEKTSPLAG